MNRNVLLTEHFINQFNVSVLENIVNTFLILVIEFEQLVSDEDYQIKFTSSNQIKVGGTKKPNNSIIESLLFTEYDNRYKQEEVLLKFRDGFNSLNEEERNVFKLIYIDKICFKDATKMLCSYGQRTRLVRNSSLIKFCIKTGLIKFEYLFK